MTDSFCHKGLWQLQPTSDSKILKVIKLKGIREYELALDTSDWCDTIPLSAMLGPRRMQRLLPFDGITSMVQGAHPPTVAYNALGNTVSNLDSRFAFPSSRNKSIEIVPILVQSRDRSHVNEWCLMALSCSPSACIMRFPPHATGNGLVHQLTLNMGKTTNQLVQHFVHSQISFCGALFQLGV